MDTATRCVSGGGVQDSNNENVVEEQLQELTANTEAPTSDEGDMSEDRALVQLATSCGSIDLQSPRPSTKSHLALISMRGSDKSKARVPLEVVCVIDTSH